MNLLQALPLLLSFLVVVICLARFYNPNRSQLNYHDKLPPSPARRLPVIGHLHLLLLSGKPPHHTFTNLACKLGSIFYLQLGQVPTVVISSPRLAKQVLTMYDHIFANRPVLLAPQYIFFGSSDVGFSPSGPYWRQVRKVCVVELLSSRRVGESCDVREEETGRLVSQISESHSAVVDLSEVIYAHTNNIITRTAFGKRFIDGYDLTQHRRLKAMIVETQELLGGFSLAEFFPRWKHVLIRVTGLKGRLERNVNNLRVVCGVIIEDHLKKRERNEGRFDEEKDDDLVDVLLRMKERHDLEVPITDDNIKAIMLDMILAGSGPTGVLIEWAMTELTKHPTIMRKAQREVRQNTSSDHKKIDFQQLQFLKAVIKETLRLHQLVPLLIPRESTERCVLDGYEIPAKTRVHINAYAVGMDQESWVNPYEFNPERFENSTNYDQEFRMFPFGGGRRGCPASMFVLAVVETTLARLLYHFDWTIPEVAGSNEEEIFGLVIKRRSPLLLVPTRVF